LTHVLAISKQHKTSSLELNYNFSLVIATCFTKHFCFWCYLEWERRKRRL